jgi:hypothetical protein
VVADHSLEYTANSDPAKDTAKVMNADNHSAYLNNVYTYTYDPRDRIAKGPGTMCTSTRPPGGRSGPRSEASSGRWTRSSRTTTTGDRAARSVEGPPAEGHEVSRYSPDERGGGPMWYTPRGIQLMSVPDLSAFLPPAVVEAVTGFVEALDEPGRARLSRALDAAIEDVAVEWREQVGDLDREAEFEHALPPRPVDVALPAIAGRRRCRGPVGTGGPALAGGCGLHAAVALPEGSQRRPDLVGR